MGIDTWQSTLAGRIRTEASTNQFSENRQMFDPQTPSHCAVIFSLLFLFYLLLLLFLCFATHAHPGTSRGKTGGVLQRFHYTSHSKNRFSSPLSGLQSESLVRITRVVGSRIVMSGQLVWGFCSCVLFHRDTPCGFAGAKLPKDWR